MTATFTGPEVPRFTEAITGATYDMRFRALRLEFESDAFAEAFAAKVRTDDGSPYHASGKFVLVRNQMCINDCWYAWDVQIGP